MAHTSRQAVTGVNAGEPCQPGIPRAMFIYVEAIPSKGACLPLCTLRITATGQGLPAMMPVRRLDRS